MSRVLVLVAACAALAACQTTAGAVPAEPLLDPCPPSASAALEPRPAEVKVTEPEQLELDFAGIKVLGAQRFGDRAMSEAQSRARTARLETRIEQTRTWCQTRRPRPG